ncbi:SRPBCC family protein [Nocardioides panacisoli]|uniref:SRPBCC family protein n=1 Tax=Nocardioides panacisoli TaxID=627624 RepID=UPI001C633118|nr:SRPBCC family protein [Nocardioides panacisoli]QYJ04348.1 SRPBCC family protein [Nocardioides panacisoli]
MTSYSFTASWIVPAPVSQVADLALDLERYPQWWPQVVAVARLGPETARVLVRSALPFTLDVVLEPVSQRLPELEVAISGTVDGWVRWRLTEVGGGTRCDYRQEVTVDGALAAASRVARPVLTWNHRRAMEGCERGMRDALATTQP